MRNPIMVFLLTSSLLPSIGLATGVPVVDVASITQMVKQAAVEAKQFTETINNARNQLDEAKQQGAFYRDMVNGHVSVFDALLNNPDLNNALALNDWQDAYNNIKNIDQLRSKYGLTSSNPAVQKYYDQEIGNFEYMKQVYHSMVARQQSINTLQKQLNQAATPRAKADLTNALGIQQLQQKNAEALMVSMAKVSEGQQKLEQAQKTKVFYEQAFSDK